MWVVQRSDECFPSERERRISAGKDSSNQRNTVLFRLFTPMKDVWGGSTATAADFRGGSVEVNVWGDERNDCNFDFACAHVSFMRTYSVCFCTSVCNPLRFLRVLCSQQRLGIHVALQPTFIYVEAVTSRINALFWRHLRFLLLSLFVNSTIFPLRFWLTFAEPGVCSSRTVQFWLLLVF